jgi:hypothetical protein
MTRLPWIKWYSKDALGDPMLRMVGPEARGIWYDMLWLMDVSDRRGYLTRNGHPWPEDELCRILAVTQEELTRAKAKLLSAGVPSIEPETGIWFNRRMVRDERRRTAGHEFGRKGGGNPALKTPSESEKRPEAICQKPEARTPIKETFIGRSKGNLSVTPAFDTDSFKAAWADWQQHRREIRKPLTPKAAEGQMRQFADWGEARAVAAIRHTITMGWQGIREKAEESQRWAVNSIAAGARAVARRD